MRVVTAKKTANLTDSGGHRRTILESGGAGSNCSGPLWTPVDHGPAVFKTVWGVRRRSPEFTFVRQRPCRRRMTANDSQERTARRGGKFQDIERTGFPANGFLNRLREHGLARVLFIDVWGDSGLMPITTPHLHQAGKSEPGETSL